MALADDILADSPLVYLPLTETSGTTATNLGSGGAALNGTYVNCTLNQAGVSGGAPSFNGTSSYINIPQAALHAELVDSNDTAWTAEAWFSHNLAVTGVRVIFRDVYYGSGIKLETGVLQGHFDSVASGTQLIWAGGNSDSSLQTYWDDARWHHVAFTWSAASGTKLYVDGILLGSLPASAARAQRYGAGSFRLGADGTTSYFSGKLAHFAYYETELSAARVAARARWAPFELGWKARPNTSGYRSGAGSFVINDIIYVVSGLKNGSFTNEVIAYDPVTGTSTIKAVYPQSRVYLGKGTVTADGKGLVGGGYNSSGSSTNIVYEYDPVANTWATPPAAQYSKYGTWIVGPDANGYIWRGAGGNSIIERRDPGNKTWAAWYSGSASNYHGNAVYENGCIYYMNAGSTALYRLSVSNTTIGVGSGATMAVCPYSFGSQQGMEVKGGKIYVFAGTVGSNRRRTAIYDIATNTWSTSADLPRGGEFAVSASALGRVYHLGGHADTYRGSVYSYTVPALEGSALMTGTGVIQPWAEGLSSMVGTGVYELSDADVEFGSSITPGPVRGTNVAPIPDGTPFPSPPPALLDVRTGPVVQGHASGTVYRSASALTRSVAEDGTYWNDWEVGGTAWMRWEAPATGWYVFDSIGSNEVWAGVLEVDTDTVLAVYRDGDAINEGSGNGSPYWASWIAASDDLDTGWEDDRPEAWGGSGRVEVYCVGGQVYNIMVAPYSDGMVVPRLQLNWKPYAVDFPIFNEIDHQSATFEGGVGGWLATSGPGTGTCSIAEYTDDSDEGSSSMVVTCLTAGDCFVYLGRDPLAGASPGVGFPVDLKSVVGMHSVRPLGGKTLYVTMFVYYYDAAGGFVGQMGVSALEEATYRGWQRRSGAASVTAGATYGIHFHIDNMEVGDQVLIDRVGYGAGSYGSWQWSEPPEHWRRVVDPVGALDGTLSSADFRRNEAIGLTDSRVVAIGQQFTDVVGGTDSTLQTSAALREATDGVGGVDVPVQAVGAIREATDGVGGVDTATEEHVVG